ncbi:ABC-type uncharacterized transport system, permease and ATPase component [Neorhizobium galegae bv. officinalis]|uniref:ABC-type uncharacterized transport system, permease and ATPase component n=1 Tax=Neorhizobium galegae bv. officinalis TaxID=323656 RepID=A0A0T7F8Q8_NEOGA|nr:ABC-type uncharacterized transport system, permease and ATPase component [Neorhizobium galegae bv. officinalis]
MSAMEMPKPQAEHGFLERMVGLWEVTSTSMGHDEKWVEVCRALNGIWFVAEGSGEMPGGGGPATTILTLGYDPAKGKYVGTWLGTMMNHLWVYEGEVSDDGSTLNLYTSGPDFANPGKTGDYREQIIFTDDDHRTFNSSAKQPDGTWQQFMEAHYARKR